MMFIVVMMNFKWTLVTVVYTSFFFSNINSSTLQLFNFSTCQKNIPGLIDKNLEVSREKRGDYYTFTFWETDGSEMGESFFRWLVMTAF